MNWNEPAMKFYKALGAVPMDEWTLYRLKEKEIIRLNELNKRKVECFYFKSIPLFFY